MITQLLADRIPHGAVVAIGAETSPSSLNTADRSRKQFLWAHCGNTKQEVCRLGKVPRE